MTHDQEVTQGVYLHKNTARLVKKQHANYKLPGARVKRRKASWNGGAPWGAPCPSEPTHQKESQNLLRSIAADVVPKKIAQATQTIIANQMISQGRISGVVPCAVR